MDPIKSPDFRSGEFFYSLVRRLEDNHMTSRAVELWQSFVDTFANIGDGVHRCWIMERVSYPFSDKNRDINALLAALTEAQREVLTTMMIQAHHGGVFDALARLHDRLVLNDGKYVEDGVEMAFEPHGYKLYEDYVRRRAGDPWIYSRDA